LLPYLQLDLGLEHTNKIEMKAIRTSSIFNFFWWLMASIIFYRLGIILAIPIEIPFHWLFLIYLFPNEKRRNKRRVIIMPIEIFLAVAIASDYFGGLFINIFR